MAAKESVPKINYNDLVKIKKLGEGSFGEVYLAQAKSGPLPTNKNLAVKILKDSYFSESETEFAKELDIFKKVGTHKNVVQLLGYCKDPQKSCIVMEYITITINNNEISGFQNYLLYLKQHSEKNGRSLSHQEMKEFALQVAQGMEHLENKKIVHRDLATRNILIDSSKTLKVSDFGLSRDGLYMAQNNVLPIRWSAPEAITHRLFSHKSDVWSFGIVLWEITTLGMIPYHTLSDKDVVKLVEKGGHPDKPKNVAKELHDIMLKCWNQRAFSRPSFSDLVKEINHIHLKTSMGSQKDDLKTLDKLRGLKISKSPRAPKTVLHSGIVCDGCRGDIYGNRYICTICSNYDLCQNCKDSGHHNYHLFCVLRNPDLYVYKIHYNVTCDACGRCPIVGSRFKCSVCPNYDLCIRCKTSDIHNYHTFSCVANSARDLVMDPLKMPARPSNQNVARAPIAVRHPSIRCDECKSQIYGNRYMCTVCSHYDLCQDCKNSGHHSHHTFCLLQTPDLNSTIIHLTVRCDACDECPILGSRYKCSVCSNYDLCQRCKSNNIHSYHTFSCFSNIMSTLDLKKDPLTTHHNVVCDNCNMNPIRGPRFMCTFCDNFDLCIFCKVKGHHNYHSFEYVL